MSETLANNRRIAKNTLFLYMRMLFLMLISLYTSRVILNALGVEDYGIYNVVGGIVTMFSILSGSLSAAMSRFITFELGAGNTEKLKKVFSSSVTIQVAIALIVIALAETAGLWFLNEKMEIPENRMTAANWCFQISIITFIINLISVPYNAAIIAHEKMSTFAFISMLEGIGKLIIAWCIIRNPIDRLIFFAMLVAILSWTIRFIYTQYCKRHFEECIYHFIYDHNLLKQMFSFAGWNFLGAGSALLIYQGVDLLSNIYFGVTVNAARGIASQVNRAVMQFVNNFTTAINPQITKSYASNQKEYMFSLMFRGAKFSYLLVLLFAVPIICETPMILKLWLKVVPDHTIAFVRLTIVVSLIQVLSNTMITAMLATGNIKKYQIIVGGLGMLVFPMSWLFFVLGLPPEIAYVSVIIVFIAQWICRLNLMRKMIGMSVSEYMKNVMIKVIISTLLAFPLPMFICAIWETSVSRLIVVTVVSLIFTSIIIYFIGMSYSERYFLFREVKVIYNGKRT